MALTDLEKMEIRLQTLYDIRNVFRGSLYSEVRTYIDEIIRVVQADIAIAEHNSNVKVEPEKHS